MDGRTTQIPSILGVSRDSNRLSPLQPQWCVGAAPGYVLGPLLAGNEVPRQNPTYEGLGLRCTEPPLERPVFSPLSADQWQQFESLVDALLDNRRSDAVPCSPR